MGTKSNFGRLCATVWIFGGMAAALIITVFMQLALYIICLPMMVHSPWFREQVLGRVLRFWCSCTGKFLNPFWKVKVVRPAQKGYKPGRTIFMCNHQSGADPWVVAPTLMPWECKWVYKSGLRSVPFAGWAVRMSGDLPVYFTKEKGGWQVEPGSVETLMDGVREHLRNGTPTMIFPEGTRSRTGGIQPFKDGFFRLAMEEKCDIQPVVVHGSQDLWPLASKWVYPGTCYVAFADPVKCSELPEGTTIEQLRTQVRNTMLDLQSQCPNFDPVAHAPLNSAPAHRGLGLSGKGTKGE